MNALCSGVLSVLAAGFVVALPNAALAAPTAEEPKVEAPAAASANAVVADKAVTSNESADKSSVARAANSIYAEGLGAGLAYSINYERLVIDDLAVRAGFSYLSVSASATTSEGTVSASSSLTTIPVTVSYLGVGSKKHILEMGGGFSFAFASGSASGFGRSASGSGMDVIPDLLLGYRLHPVDGAGFNFRVGAMALVGKGLGFDVTDPDAVGVLPWGYLSMGASF